MRGFVLWMALSTLLLAPGCSRARVPQPELPPEPRTVRINGSDTMLPLIRSWAAEYMRNEPGTSVYVQGGGSARGVRDLIEGRVDIAASSRPVEAEEVKGLAERFGSVGRTIVVAKEALSIYIHPMNPVRDLSLDQLRSIFTGSFQNWRELGGEDLAIHTVRRSANSGTYLYFMDHVLDGQAYASGAAVRATTEAVLELVSSDPSAIGYGGIAFGRDFHGRVNGVLPTEENIREGTYPIRRYLFLLTASRPRGSVKDFLDWVVSPPGQALVSKSGYVSLW